MRRQIGFEFIVAQKKSGTRGQHAVEALGRLSADPLGDCAAGEIEIDQRVSSVAARRAAFPARFRGLKPAAILRMSLRDNNAQCGQKRGEGAAVP
jgi:hypothetical protein